VIRFTRTEQEAAYWNKFVAEGWAQGEKQAVEIFLSDLGRLQRDIVGMARYRVLLRAGWWSIQGRLSK